MKTKNIKLILISLPIILFLTNCGDSATDPAAATMVGTWSLDSMTAYENETCTGEGETVAVSGGFWTIFNHTKVCNATTCDETTTYTCSGCTDESTDSPCCAEEGNITNTADIYSCDILSYTQEGSAVTFTKSDFCSNCAISDSTSCSASFTCSDDPAVTGEQKCEWQEGYTAIGTLTGNTLMMTEVDYEECYQYTFTK